MNEKERLYDEVVELRKKLKNDSRAIKVYKKLKEKNLNPYDELYGWEFDHDAILTDTLEDLDLYQDPYVRDLLRVYKNDLENILLRSDL